MKNDPPIKGSGNLLFRNKFLRLRCALDFPSGNFSSRHMQKSRTPKVPSAQSTVVQPRRNRIDPPTVQEPTRNEQQQQNHIIKIHPNANFLNNNNKANETKEEKTPERLRPDSRGNFQHPISLVRGSDRTRARNEIPPLPKAKGSVGVGRRRLFSRELCHP